ncbi:MAG: hypothetical protein ACRDL5_06165 [Solirubrobacteraceae bacterium]
MRLFARKGATEPGAAVLAEPPPASFGGTDEALDAEIERLAKTGWASATLEVERALLRLRNEAGVRRLQTGTDAASFPDAASVQLPPPGSLPEFSPADLTPAVLRAAILRDGCVLVRGLIPRRHAEELATLIDRAFAERSDHDGGRSHDAAFYEEFISDPRAGEPLTTREWIKQGGGVLSADSPAVSYRMTELFSAARLPALVGAYLGESPLVAVEKTTLRKADPGVPGGWHQDGKFMGEVRALNLWLALSRCGDIAPGLDIVPLRFDQLLTAQTDDAVLDYVISQRMVEVAAGETPILRPTFEPGDALFFDELFLHKTGSDADMPQPRFAIENWFFGASGFPAQYAPMSV